MRLQANKLNLISLLVEFSILKVRGTAASFFVSLSLSAIAMRQVQKLYDKACVLPEQYHRAKYRIGIVFIGVYVCRHN